MFKAPELEKNYGTDGYVLFDMLPADVVQQAKDVYAGVQAAHDKVPDKFKGSSRIEDPEVINAINNRLAALVTPFVHQHFLDCNLLGYNFLVKEPGADSAIGAHQDWTYVDETRYTSCNVWIALEDMTIANGCLWVVPGSHRIGSYLRAAPAYPVPFAGIGSFVERFKVPVLVKAGSCVCFNNKTIHGSYPNLSANTRLAVVTTVYPGQARLLHYYIHNSAHVNQLMQYELEPQVFLNLKKGFPPPQYITSQPATTHYPAWSRLYFAWQLAKARLAACLS